MLKNGYLIAGLLAAATMLFGIACGTETAPANPSDELPPIEFPTATPEPAAPTVPTPEETSPEKDGGNPIAIPTRAPTTAPETDNPEPTPSVAPTQAPAPTKTPQAEPETERVKDVSFETGSVINALREANNRYPVSADSSRQQLAALIATNSAQYQNGTLWTPEGLSPHMLAHDMGIADPIDVLLVTETVTTGPTGYADWSASGIPLEQAEWGGVHPSTAASFWEAGGPRGKHWTLSAASVTVADAETESFKRTTALVFANAAAKASALPDPGHEKLKLIAQGRLPADMSENPLWAEVRQEVPVSAYGANQLNRSWGYHAGRVDKTVAHRKAFSEPEVDYGLSGPHPSSLPAQAEGAKQRIELGIRKLSDPNSADPDREVSGTNSASPPSPRNINPAHQWELSTVTGQFTIGVTNNVYGNASPGVHTLIVYAYRTAVNGKPAYHEPIATALNYRDTRKPTIRLVSREAEKAEISWATSQTTNRKEVQTVPLKDSGTLDFTKASTVTEPDFTATGTLIQDLLRSQSYRVRVREVTPAGNKLGWSDWITLPSLSASNSVAPGSQNNGWEPEPWAKITLSERSLLKSINESREQNGLASLLLVRTDGAESPSAIHAKDMAEKCYLSSWNTDGTTPNIRQALAGNPGSLGWIALGHDYCPPPGSTEHAGKIPDGKEQSLYIATVAGLTAAENSTLIQARLDYRKDIATGSTTRAAEAGERLREKVKRNKSLAEKTTAWSNEYILGAPEIRAMLLSPHADRLDVGAAYRSPDQVWLVINTLTEAVKFSESPTIRDSQITLAGELQGGLEFNNPGDLHITVTWQNGPWELSVGQISYGGSHSLGLPVGEIRQARLEHTDSGFIDKGQTSKPFTRVQSHIMPATPYEAPGDAQAPESGAEAAGRRAAALIQESSPNREVVIHLINARTWDVASPAKDPRRFRVVANVSALNDANRRNANGVYNVNLYMKQDGKQRLLATWPTLVGPSVQVPVKYGAGRPEQAADLQLNAAGIGAQATRGAVLYNLNQVENWHVLKQLKPELADIVLEQPWTGEAMSRAARRALERIIAIALLEIRSSSSKDTRIAEALLDLPFVREDPTPSGVAALTAMFHAAQQHEKAAGVTLGSLMDTPAAKENFNAGWTTQAAITPAIAWAWQDPNAAEPEMHSYRAVMSLRQENPYRIQSRARVFVNTGPASISAIHHPHVPVGNVIDKAEAFIDYYDRYMAGDLPLTHTAIYVYLGKVEADHSPCWDRYDGGENLGSAIAWRIGPKNETCPESADRNIAIAQKVAQAYWQGYETETADWMTYGVTSLMAYLAEAERHDRAVQPHTEPCASPSIPNIREALNATQGNREAEQCLAAYTERLFVELHAENGDKLTQARIQELHTRVNEQRLRAQTVKQREMLDGIFSDPNSRNIISRWYEGGDYGPRRIPGALFTADGTISPRLGHIEADLTQGGCNQDDNEENAEESGTQGQTGKSLCLRIEHHQRVAGLNDPILLQVRFYHQDGHGYESWLIELPAGETVSHHVTERAAAGLHWAEISYNGVAILGVTGRVGN